MKICSWKSWDGVDNQYVRVNTPNPSLSAYTWQLDQQNYLNVSYTSSTVSLNTEVIVGKYLVVGVAPLQFLIPQGQTKVTSSSSWGTSYIP